MSRMKKFCLNIQSTTPGRWCVSSEESVVCMISAMFVVLHYQTKSYFFRWIQFLSAKLTLPNHSGNLF